MQKNRDNGYYKNKYRIDSTRLKGWNYSNNGYYFVTICTKNRIHHFGEIRDNKMDYSKIGTQAKIYWKEIPNHFPFSKIDAYQIMPDHIHGIVVIDKIPGTDAINQPLINKRTGVINHASTIINPMGKGTLGEIIRWYKGRLTYEIRWKYNLNFAWQPLFYDRIIRDTHELHNVRNYIRNNPKNWVLDGDDY